MAVAVGNIADHARNHAAFWDGTELTVDERLYLWERQILNPYAFDAYA